jgi:2-polyprenyl-3-methyl-5-hydroxy-6-metoxy-1,4-benzoquinol methylase
MKKIYCPLCGSSFISLTKLKKKGYSLKKCKNCKLGFINPIPSNKILERYYRNYLDRKKQICLNRGIEKIRKDTFWKQRLLLLRKFCKENITLLDVGSGTGEWLDLLDKNKIDFRGLEISEDESRLLEGKFGAHVLNKSLANFKTSEKYDVITLWDVIEHFNDIDKNFKKIISLLKDRGLICLSTVNIESFLSKLRKTKWRYFYPPEHIFYFSYSSLEYLAKKYKLKIVFIQSELKLQAFKSVSIGEGKINPLTYKLKSSIENIINLFINKNGDIITVCLRK